MKTSPLDPEVPAQPLSQCLELPLPVAWTEAVNFLPDQECSIHLHGVKLFKHARIFKIL